ncbi:MAG TPA: hypothetical protein VLC46_20355 [Thermoanaerobaculia bacterium]|nr:hypothetical protein [Thermoanaerobaculia bacterium]
MRIALKLTQRQVATLAGVAESTVKRTEKRGRGHNFVRIKKVLDEAEKKGAPRAAVEHIAIEIDGSPSDLVREFQALLDGMQTVEQQWAAVRAFALTAGSVAEARLRRGTTGDDK